MQAGGAAAVPVVVYGARAYDDALLELTDVLTAMGFRCGAAVAALAEHSIFRQFGAGRPNEQDRAELAGFAQEIYARYQAQTLGAQVTVPGKRPYVKASAMPVHPTANKKCVQCGVCAAQCPAGAISAPNFAKTDATKCMTCMRCVAVCPEHARGMNPVLMKILPLAMAKAFAGERHNECFLEQV